MYYTSLVPTVQRCGGCTVHAVFVCTHSLSFQSTFCTLICKFSSLVFLPRAKATHTLYHVPKSELHHLHEADLERLRDAHRQVCESINFAVLFRPSRKGHHRLICLCGVKRVETSAYPPAGRVGKTTTAALYSLRAGRIPA